MNNDNKPYDTINKSLLLNWLYSSEKEVSIEQLGKFIEAKTEGKYALLKIITKDH